MNVPPEHPIKEFDDAGAVTSKGLQVGSKYEVRRKGGKMYLTFTVVLPPDETTCRVYIPDEGECDITLHLYGLQPADDGYWDKIYYTVKV